MPCSMHPACLAEWWSLTPIRLESRESERGIVVVVILASTWTHDFAPDRTNRARTQAWFGRTIPSGCFIGRDASS